MYIIEVIPLTVLPPQVPQILTYFHDQALARGAVVEVSIQKKSVRAIVVSSGTLEQQKISVKKSGFQLKKITKVIVEASQVTAQQFQLALWLAKQYYAPLGMSLNAVLPPFFAKRGYVFEMPGLQVDEEPPSELAIAPPLFIEARAYQTKAALEPYIKDTVRHGGQVLLMTPDTTTAQYLFAQFKDMAPSCFVNSSLTNAEFFEAWKNVSSGDCKIIVGTRTSLFLPFRDLWMIAVEDPFHEAYKSDFSPKYNAPDVALKVAALYGARPIFVAPIPNLSIHQTIDQKFFEHERTRTPSQTKPLIVDIAYERKTGNFSLLSRELQKQLLKSLRTQERILLFSARRAYAGILMCQNCSTLTKCSNCDIPMRVHQTSERMLVCYRCSAYLAVPAACPNCHSANLRPSGTAGSQKIEEEVRAFLTREGLAADVFILDTDLIRDDEQEQEMLKAIAASSQPIVIATQMAFSHRYAHRYDLVGVINVDALMSSADFRAEERFLAHYEKILDFQPHTIVLQTYNPESAILAAGINEDYQSFYAQELPLRKSLHYPPFSRLVKLRYSHGSEAKAAYEARVLNEQLRRAIALEKLEEKVRIIGPTPATVAREQSQYHFGVILKIAPELEHIDTILKYVPTSWQIDVDPRQML